MAYTYLIGWAKHDRWYYGMRGANVLKPEDDHWEVYKTSSKYVHKFAEENGYPNIIKVHKEFETPEEAYEFETRFLRRVNAIRNDRWLNQNIMGKPQGGTPAQLAAVKGKKQSEEHKRKRGILDSKSQQHKQRISESVKGERNGMYGRTGENHPGYGKKRTPEQIENIRQGQLKAVALRKEKGITIAYPPRTPEMKLKYSEAAKRRCAARKAKGLGRYNQ